VTQAHVGGRRCPLQFPQARGARRLGAKDACPVEREPIALIARLGLELPQVRRRQRRARDRARGRRPRHRRRGKRVGRAGAEPTRLLAPGNKLSDSPEQQRRRPPSSSSCGAAPQAERETWRRRRVRASSPTLPLRLRRPINGAPSGTRIAGRTPGADHAGNQPRVGIVVPHVRSASGTQRHGARSRRPSPGAQRAERPSSAESLRALRSRPCFTTAPAQSASEKNRQLPAR
jgi:hypothetical protein